VNREKIKELVAQLLVELGENPQREGLRDTPQRVADLYEEVLKGYDSDSELDVVFTERSDFIMQRDIPFYSMCEHHLLPFFGKAHIAYQPNGKVIGISKLSRLVEKYARRLQLQERMTHQIANELQGTGVLGAIVVVEGEHLCLRMRGVKSNGITVTSEARGTFNDPMVKTRLFDLMLEVKNRTSAISHNPPDYSPLPLIDQ
jgi:GTP cyclohydrolase I